MEHFCSAQKGFFFDIVKQLTRLFYSFCTAINYAFALKEFLFGKRIFATFIAVKRPQIFFFCQKRKEKGKGVSEGACVGGRRGRAITPQWQKWVQIQIPNRVFSMKVLPSPSFFPILKSEIKTYQSNSNLFNPFILKKPFILLLLKILFTFYNFTLNFYSRSLVHPDR